MWSPGPLCTTGSASPITRERKEVRWWHASENIWPQAAMSSLTSSMRKRRRERCSRWICGVVLARLSQPTSLRDGLCSCTRFITSVSVRSRAYSVYPFIMAAGANSCVLSSFLDYLRIEKGLAPLSIAAYTTDIGQFSEFLEKRKRLLLNARRVDVRDFLQ